MQRSKYSILIGLSSLCCVFFLEGCSDLVLFDPKGPIGGVSEFVIIAAILLMLIVVVPVFIMAFWFPLKYRASNPNATYMPKWSYSAKIDFTMWAVPVAIVTVLAYLAWSRTHQLDPYKPIHSQSDPVNIQVIALDWKYLFIYTDYDLAVVNQLVFPAKVPLSFRLTSDTVITSFFIPQLGSQIYAMAGRQTRLHLLADEPGTFLGQNQQFSGNGYADMHFNAVATSEKDFQAWLQKARQSPEKLDLAHYQKLAKPSAGYPVTFFSSVEPGLFDHIIRKYKPDWGKSPGQMEKNSVSDQPESGGSNEP